MSAQIDLDAQHAQVLKAFSTHQFEDKASKWLAKHKYYCPDEDESEWTACDIVVNYIIHLWDRDPKTLLKPEEYLWSEISDMRGVFEIGIGIGIESHAFVIWIRDDTVRIYQGYGGEYSPTYFEEDRETWIGLFMNPPSTQHERYNAIYSDILRVDPATTFRLGTDYHIDDSAYCSRIW